MKRDFLHFFNLYNSLNQKETTQNVFGTHSCRRHLLKFVSSHFSTQNCKKSDNTMFKFRDTLINQNSLQLTNTQQDFEVQKYNIFDLTTDLTLTLAKLYLQIKKRIFGSLRYECLFFCVLLV